MENTQGVWIIYINVLTLNFLATKKHWVMKTTRLNLLMF